MSTNAELIQQGYAAFARGDVPFVIGMFDPAIEWNEAENFVYAGGNPYIGPEAILAGVFAHLATEWDGFAAVPERFIEALSSGGGATVAVQGRYKGTYKATGRSVDAQFVHVWDVSNGKATRFQQYTDTLQFARAVRG